MSVRVSDPIVNLVNIRTGNREFTRIDDGALDRVYNHVARRLWDRTVGRVTSRAWHRILWGMNE